jgi:hypothetical protein
MARKPEADVIAAKEAKKWQAREDLSTLQRAEEIRTDQARMKAAEREAREQMKALEKTVSVKSKKKKKKKAK